MPFIRGRYYMNPAYGRAIEIARDSGGTLRNVSSAQHSASARWVTINGRHVLIAEPQDQHPLDS